MTLVERVARELARSIGYDHGARIEALRCVEINGDEIDLFAIARTMLHVARDEIANCEGLRSAREAGERYGERESDAAVDAYEDVLEMIDVAMKEGLCER